MKPETLTDQALLKAFREAGDQTALSCLIRRHRRRVLNYIVMMVKNRQVADDLYQDTLIKVINSLRSGNYTDNGKFVSWVLRIAHNQVIDYFRGEKKPVHLTNDDIGYDILNDSKLSDPTIEEEMIRDQNEQDIRTLIDHLPIEQREVVVLRHYMDMSFKDIAEHTGVSVNTALGRMRYALINLRKEIGEKQITFR